jgi:hypothetical protein
LNRQVTDVWEGFDVLYINHETRLRYSRNKWKKTDMLGRLYGLSGPIIFYNFFMHIRRCQLTSTCFIVENEVSSLNCLMKCPSSSKDMLIWWNPCLLLKV